jgi:hypothetical protein
MYGNYYTLFHLPDSSWIAKTAPSIPLMSMSAVGRTSENEALSVLLSHINAEKYYWQDSLREKKLRMNTKIHLPPIYQKGNLNTSPYDEDQSIEGYATLFKCTTYPSAKSGKYYVDALNGMVLKFLPAEIGLLRRIFCFQLQWKPEFEHLLQWR